MSRSTSAEPPTAATLVDQASAASQAIPPPPVSAPAWTRHFGRAHRWGRVGVEFAAWQVTLQFLNVLVGFAVLRWLPKEDYAQFSFAFGFQAMLTMLLDLGATGAITALVGDRTGDPAVVGGYVAAARSMRARLAWIVLPAGAVAFYLAGARHGWSPFTTVLLLGSVTAAVFAQGSASIYSAPLLMHRRLASWYWTGSAAAAGRLIAISALQALSALSGWLTAWVNTLAIAGTAYFYRRAGAGLAIEPHPAPPAMRRELWRYLAPLIPGAVFTAFQGQITIFLVTLLGRTDAIAEVAALGRLGQIFALLAAFNTVVLQPKMAALPAHRVFSTYATVLALSVLVGGALCALGWVWPKPLLWLIGPKYSHLVPELRLLLLASSLQYVAGVMWAMHAARKWIYWWGSALFIGGTLLVQVVLLATVDVSSAAGAMRFAVYSALVPLGVHLVTVAYAFGRRTAPPAPLS